MNKKPAVPFQLVPSKLTLKNDHEIRFALTILSHARENTKVKTENSFSTITIGEDAQEHTLNLKSWLKFQKIGPETVKRIKENWSFR